MSGRRRNFRRDPDHKHNVSATGMHYRDPQPRLSAALRGERERFHLPAPAMPETLPIRTDFANAMPVLPTGDTMKKRLEQAVWALLAVMWAISIVLYVVIIYRHYTER